LAVRGKTAGEAPVDLQSIDRQLGQACEGRASGAGVVDADARARGAQKPERVDAGGGITRENSFGNLEVDPPVRIACQIADALEDLVRDLAAAQLRRRYIDGHPQRRQTLHATRATVGRRLSYDPCPGSL